MFAYVAYVHELARVNQPCYTRINTEQVGLSFHVTVGWCFNGKWTCGFDQNPDPAQQTKQNQFIFLKFIYMHFIVRNLVCACS